MAVLSGGTERKRARQGDLALPMHNVHLMSSSMYFTYCLFLASVFSLSAFTVKAQTSDARTQPTISRVCLWNADKDTWNTLGLKRSQIARMAELREQYPAVVDGQWVEVEDEIMPAIGERQSDVAPNASTSITGPALGAAATGTKIEDRTPDTTTRSTGLQHELRAVLTPLQLQRWAEECVF